MTASIRMRSVHRVLFVPKNLNPALNFLEGSLSKSHEVDLFVVTYLFFMDMYFRITVYEIVLDI